ncbi:MAG: DUF2764 family protein, partial [Candidatus Omnitrophica bacterium]|nr:DUF2764 family protein [Candidatus Omnitrophota bacterium]
LPYLKFEEKPPINKTEFISECEKWLSPGHMRNLLTVDVDVFGQEIVRRETPLIRKWKVFDEDARRIIAKAREAKKTGASFKVPEKIQTVINQATPLLVEMKFERIRWDFLEGESSKYFFDMNWLILYFLKLQILNRIAVFNKDEGEKFFYNLCEVNHEKAIG